jgi:hypothetical protein
VDYSNVFIVVTCVRWNWWGGRVVPAGTTRRGPCRPGGAADTCDRRHSVGSIGAPLQASAGPRTAGALGAGRAPRSTQTPNPRGPSWKRQMPDAAPSRRTGETHVGRKRPSTRTRLLHRDPGWSRDASRGLQRLKHPGPARCLTGSAAHSQWPRWDGTCGGSRSGRGAHDCAAERVAFYSAITSR